MKSIQQDQANVNAILTKQSNGEKLTFIEKNILKIHDKRIRNEKKNISQDYMNRHKNTKK